MRGSEKTNLLNMLDSFITHISQTDNKSLISRIYGVFTIETNIFAPIDIIIM